ncbi:MAG: HlyD family secretion protein, partial [Pseudomonadota bacterium]
MSSTPAWWHSPRSWIIGLTALIVIAIIYYVAADRTTPFTTDAYVQAFVVQVAPRIDGQVVEILVEEGSQVAAGDPLFRLDPTPYQYTVDRLNASLTATQSNVDSLQAQLEHYQAITKQREADVTFAQATYDRNLKLEENSFAAKQRLDQSLDELRSNQALLSQSRADVADINTQLESMVGDEHSSVAEARAQLNAANFELGQTTVFAAVDGVVDNLQLSEGTYLESGDFVMSLIDTSRKWIVANYPENALSVIAPGQKAKLSFFMYPGKIFDGEVAA